MKTSFKYTFKNDIFQDHHPSLFLILLQHLKVRQAIWVHIADTNTDTGIKVSMYLANTKMASLTTEGMDVDLRAAAQV